MDKEINNNGFDYVDLDLPSGTLWATMNVGASKPSDYGLYFQWGDTKGYDKNQIGRESGQKSFEFDYSDYKWYLSGNTVNETIAFTKYIAPNDKLELEDDATHVNMGGDWHMPSSMQLIELYRNTIREWTTLDGVNGMTFTSKKDESKFIFIPAAGYAWDGSVRGSGGSGDVLSSISSNEYVDSMQVLGFGSGGVSLGYGERYYGCSVRGVIG